MTTVAVQPDFAVKTLRSFFAHVLPARPWLRDRPAAADGLVRWLSEETALVLDGGGDSLEPVILAAVDGTDGYALLAPDCALAGPDADGAARALFDRLVRAGVQIEFRPGFSA